MSGVMMKRKDCHHLLNTARQWNAEPIGKKLRENGSLIFRIDREVHEELHREVPPVPLLGHYALLGTIQRYQPSYDPTKDLDALCLAMDKTVRGSRFNPIERELAGLAMEVIQLQKPFIYEGLVR